MKKELGWREAFVLRRRQFAAWLAGLMARIELPFYFPITRNDWRDVAAMLNGQSIDEARKAELKAKFARLGG